MSRTTLKKLAQLVSDLFWDQDRMSQSGKETLNKIADLIIKEGKANESK